MRNRVRSLGCRLSGSLFCLAVMTGFLAPVGLAAEESLKVGVAQVEITPPLGFPMAGYYHERLATGTIDPLWAKAVYFQNGETQCAWVVCDLTGVSTDLSNAVRQQAAKNTGIPVEHLVVSGTHSHTAPSYYRSLYLAQGSADELKSDRDRQWAAYTGELINHIAQAIGDAQKAAQPVRLLSGSVQQETQVSYCRRSVMQDGSVRTWVGLKHPQAVRLTAPIDPEIGLIQILSAKDNAPTGLISNFALHLDTTGGLLWSADYPYAIEQTVRRALGENVISLFGTGCCGDINHIDPTGKPRRKAVEIGEILGQTMVAGLPQLSPVNDLRLQVRQQIVPLALQEVAPAEVLHSLDLLKTVKSGQKIDFYDHVRACKRMMLDQLTHGQPHPETEDYVLGPSRSLQGIGESLPVDVTVMTLGRDIALVFLPGEVFTELGMSIKRASPFRTTLVVELTNHVETMYIPNRQGYVGGGYEPTNSLVQPGSGERLVEAAVSLLRESATELMRNPPATEKNPGQKK
jgi:hypothetical protein